MKQIKFLLFHDHTTCKDNFVFLKLVSFFPWLAGWFYNFELTQTEKKQEMA
jgi:hypothetical protein